MGPMNEVEGIEITKPKSLCVCKHNGDGPNSAHLPSGLGTPGHGPCSKCGCAQFTWARWTLYGKKIFDKVKKIREARGT